MKHLYFVRHGLSEMNKLGIFSGRTETPLAKEGQEQARQAGEQAKSLRIDHIISSPMSRAHETAQIIARTIGYPEDRIELNSLLVERHFGVLEGTAYDPLIDLDSDGIVDAELFDELKDRMRLAYEHIASLPYDNILVVSHGSSGRMLRHIASPDIPFLYPNTADHLRHKMKNATIVELEIKR